MAGYDSPIGSKNLTGNKMREFDVPDESEYSNQGTSNQFDVNSTIRNNNMQQLDHNAIKDFQAQLDSQNMDVNDAEREFKQARQAKLQGSKERLNDGAKRRIEMLIGMTKSTREVDIEGKIFILQTLRAKEMRQATMATAEFDGTVQFPYEFRRQLLSRSLSHVAGIEMAQFIGSNTMEARLAFVDEQDDLFLNRLYDEYCKLVDDAKKKYTIKNDDEAKEVMEDLKK